MIKQTSISGGGGSPARFRPQNLFIHALLSFGAVLSVGPFIWMVLTSFKSLGESTQIPPVILPGSFKFSNYTEVISTLPFLNFYLNTIVTAAGRTAGQLLFCSLAAYAFARINFPGRHVLFILILAILMIPGNTYLIPQYLIIKNLGWLNSLQALFVPGMFSAFGTFLLRQFFLSLPKELEEAARLDGANHFDIYRRILLPLARPGLVALAIITILWSWNDLLWPLVINDSPDKLTLSAGIASLQGQYLTNYPLLMAGAVLATWPMVVLFILLQRQFIEGIALTGSKG